MRSPINMRITPTKGRTITHRKAVRIADQKFSVFIRTRDRGRCFTCGKVDEIKKMQNGHYISRSNFALRYDEINCNAQCYRCNISFRGNIPTYSINLMRKYGPEILDKLDRVKDTIRKWSVMELLTFAQECEERTLELQRKYGCS